MDGTIRIGALLSGSGSNLQAIIDACNSKRVDGKVVFAGADKPDAYGLKRAQENGIPTFVADYKKITAQAQDGSIDKSLPGDFDLEQILASQQLISESFDEERQARYFRARAICEAALLKEMASYPFDLLVLAGFMRVLSPYFIDRVNTNPKKPRIMNIHPALLPAFPGVDGYGDTFRYGCKVGGCTVHFLDYGEDTGPIIGQKSFRITSDDTLESVKARGLNLEWELYCECIQLFAQDRLKLAFKSWTLKNGSIFRRKVVQISA
ncbi:MAG: phosphoribosylglycinamide formyltransferase [Deltaproteobacteria bacterium]|nr:phosphoribosylglycinamide formyltransferase [Deltaproteobacteria bacterium]